MTTPAATISGRGLALLAVLVLGGCAHAPAAGPTSHPPAVATPTPVTIATPSTTIAPTLTVPTAPLNPTASAAQPTDHEQPPPPLGQLGATDDPPVVGRLISWCYYAGCLDGLPPPKAQLPLVELSATERRLAFSMPETASFVTWAATYAQRSLAENEKPLGRGGPTDPSEAPPGTSTLTEVTFEAPPTGDWVVNVSVWFGGAVGDAHYYWRVTVP